MTADAVGLQTLVLTGLRRGRQRPPRRRGSLLRRKERQRRVWIWHCALVKSRHRTRFLYSSTTPRTRMRSAYVTKSNMGNPCAEGRPEVARTRLRRGSSILLAWPGKTRRVHITLRRTPGPVYTQTIISAIQLRRRARPGALCAPVRPPRSKRPPTSINISRSRFTIMCSLRGHRI